MARSLADAKKLLEKNVSSRPEDWVWRNLHARQYVNLPWSKTPLKFLYHREVPFGGNNNSLNVSGLKLRANRDNIVFKSVHVAAYRMVVNFDQNDSRKDVNLYSIDTGMGAHPFMGHYFDMNNDHIHGRLRTMKIGRDVEGPDVRTLIIKKGDKSKRKPRKSSKAQESSSSQGTESEEVGHEEEL